MLDKKNRKTRVLEAIIKWPQTGISCALIILYLILAFAPTPARDTFFLSGNLVNVLRQSAISIVIGIPITFTMAAGLLDLSIGSLACLGAIVTCAFITGHSSATMEIAPQVPVFAAILIGMFVTGLFGWVNGKVITKSGAATLHCYPGNAGGGKGGRLILLPRVPGVEFAGFRYGHGPRHSDECSLYRVFDAYTAGSILDNIGKNTVWPPCLCNWRQYRMRQTIRH